MPTTTTAPTATKTTAAPATQKPPKPRKPLPAPNSDFYYLYETLPAEELAIVKRVREFMETKVAPVITDYWVERSIPVRPVAGSKEARHRRPCHEGIWLRGRKPGLVRLRPNGVRTD